VDAHLTTPLGLAVACALAVLGTALLLLRALAPARDPWRSVWRSAGRHRLAVALYRRTGSLEAWLGAWGFDTYRMDGRVYAVRRAACPVAALGRWNAVPEDAFSDLERTMSPGAPEAVFREMARLHDHSADSPPNF